MHFIHFSSKFGFNFILNYIWRKFNGIISKSGCLKVQSINDSIIESKTYLTQKKKILWPL